LTIVARVDEKIKSLLQGSSLISDSANNILSCLHRKEFAGEVRGQLSLAMKEESRKAKQETGKQIQSSLALVLGPLLLLSLRFEEHALGREARSTFPILP